MCGAAGADTPSIAFIDHETVGHVNLLNCTIETRKILLSGDGQISLKLFKFLDVPVVRALNYQLVDAVGSGDHPFITISSPVVPPDTRKRPPSALPFQSNLGTSSLFRFSTLPITRHRCNPICNLLGQSYPERS